MGGAARSPASSCRPSGARPRGWRASEARGACRPGAELARRHGWPRPRIHGARSRRPGWLARSSRSTLPAAAFGPRERRGSPPAAAHALRSRAHGSPHARASRRAQVRFLARRARRRAERTGPQGGAAAQRARRQTMEADGPASR